MKKLVIYIIPVLFFISLMGGLNSCREEIDVDLKDTIEVLPVELINTNIAGQVKDIKGKIIEGASVRIRDKESTTDQNGYFTFTNVKADKNGTVIIVSKSGYVQNRITVYPSLNHDLFSSITLTEESNSATMLSWQGGEVKLGDFGTLYIPPNTLVYESDGSNFEGTAEISFHVFDMTNPLLEHLLPGDLTGYSNSNNRKGLIPASILKIDITDGKLNTLRLATAQTAELNLTASTKYLDNWPEELLLYRFNEENNRWIRSGSALSLESNLFIGKISDFGYLCLALDYDVVQLEGSIQYIGDNSTARHTIEVNSNVQKPSMKFQTDEQGYFKSFVPASTNLELDIRNECGFVVFEETLEELNEDTQIDKILEPNTSCRNLPVNGLLLDCDGEVIKNGYVRISSDENDLFIRTDENGFYEGEFKICNDDLLIDLTAFDMEREMGTITHKNYPVNNSINIADWKICDTEGDVGLQFRNGYYFLTDDIQFELSAGSLILKGFSDFMEMDFVIWDFIGESVYNIPNDISAEFIITFTPLSESEPKLVPKDSLHLWTYKLIVERYIENELIEGSVVGLARDENHNNEEGMFYLKFSAPFIK